jgi:hypothetical protein
MLHTARPYIIGAAAGIAVTAAMASLLVWSPWSDQGDSELDAVEVTGTDSPAASSPVATVTRAPITQLEARAKLDTWFALEYSVIPRPNGPIENLSHGQVYGFLNLRCPENEFDDSEGAWFYRCDYDAVAWNEHAQEPIDLPNWSTLTARVDAYTGEVGLVR